MDFFDLTIDQDELLQRARHEAEDLAQFKDVDNLDADEIEILRALQKKLKKQQSRTPRLVISSNKGNFSNFRNKTFIPNASRVAAVATKTGKSLSVEGGATGARAGESGEVAPSKEHVSTVAEVEEEDEEKEVVKPDPKVVKAREEEEDSEEELVPKPATNKSRNAQPSRKPAKESMFNAFGDSDSEDEED